MSHQLILPEEIQAYEPMVKELIEWLEDGPRSETAFDKRFRGARPAHAITYTRKTVILGGLGNAISMSYWGQMLDLCQILAGMGFIKITTPAPYDTVWYDLGEIEIPRKEAA